MNPKTAHNSQHIFHIPYLQIYVYVYVWNVTNEGSSSRRALLHYHNSLLFSQDGAMTFRIPLGTHVKSKKTLIACGSAWPTREATTIASRSLSLQTVLCVKRKLQTIFFPSSQFMYLNEKTFCIPVIYESTIRFSSENVWVRVQVPTRQAKPCKAHLRFLRDTEQPHYFERSHLPPSSYYFVFLCRFFIYPS